MLSAADIEQAFADCFADTGTRLCGGFDEPFYRAGPPAEIHYREDYVRSALHECAHWCVAGAERRLQDDYGYWYTADGRNAAQQQAFEDVEVVPQAIESLFCEALAIPFAPSVDNLTGETTDTHAFAARIRRKADSLRAQPHRFIRAQRFIQRLQGLAQ